MIIDQTAKWGVDWLVSTYKFIIEDRQRDYNIAYMIAPLARTPQTKEGVRSQGSYAKKLAKMIEGLTPWRSSTSHLRESLKAQGVKPGQVTLLVTPGEQPIWKDAKHVLVEKKG